MIWKSFEIDFLKEALSEINVFRVREISFGSFSDRRSNDAHQRNPTFTTEPSQLLHESFPRLRHNCLTLNDPQKHLGVLVLGSYEIPMGVIKVYSTF